MKQPPSPASVARENAGLSLIEAARRARVSPSYLRQVERHGASYVLARRLAMLYGCSLNTFLPSTGDRTPQARKVGESRTP